LRSAYNAYYAKRIARRLNLKRVVLVTSRTHIIRAIAIFKRIFGAEAEIFPLEVDDSPSKEDIEREDMLRRFLPLLALFREGDDDAIREAATVLQKVIIDK
jgi:uncharacterized SAM-binding protein YcdF (DUF218 family)